MSTGGVIALVLGGLAVVFLVVNRGLVNAGVPVGHGIVAPQPSQNYGGFLAASTASGVSGVLGTLLSGFNSSLHSWLAPSSPAAAPAQNQGSSSSSPSAAAQPTGPAPGAIQPSMYVAGTQLDTSGWMIGPQTSPDTSYSATPGAAFDYKGLAFDNGYDPNASLQDFTV